MITLCGDGMKRTLQIVVYCMVIFYTAMKASAQGPLSWPVACVPGLSCLETRDSGIGYPDVGINSETFQCRAPAYKGHTGTDIYVAAVENNVPVMASADGQVMWVNDGMFDHCPDLNEPDCKPRITPICTASAGSWGPGETLSCNGTACNCLWGFNAGNFILIRHDGILGIAFTLYAHLQKGSIVVKRGQEVYQGDKIAQVGSSGNATRPHLHFGVWRSLVGNLELVNPWGSKCDKDPQHALWYSDPPFLANLPAVTKHTDSPAHLTKIDN